MRKLIESSFMSLDGVVDSPGPLTALWAGEGTELALRELDECDAFLMGRVSFDMFEKLWSGQKGHPYLDAVNAKKKYVVTKSPKPLGWNGTALGGDAARAIAELKKQPGKNLMKYGMGDLDRTLIEHRLVDAYKFSIFPVVLGKGLRAFEKLNTAGLKLTLTDTKTLANGIVRVTYEPSWS